MPSGTTTLPARFGTPLPAVQGCTSGCGTLRAGITLPHHAACVSLTLEIPPEFEAETKALAAESAGGAAPAGVTRPLVQRIGDLLRQVTQWRKDHGITVATSGHRPARQVADLEGRVRVLVRNPHPRTDSANSPQEASYVLPLILIPPLSRLRRVYTD